MPMELSCEDISNCIEKCISDLRKCDECGESIKKEIDSLGNTVQRQTSTLNEIFDKLSNSLSKEMIDIRTITNFILIKENSEDELNIDVKRFSGVLNKTEDWLLDMKGDVQEIDLEVSENLIFRDKEKSTTKGKVAKLSKPVLSSRQTQKPFICAVMQPGQRYRCISCNEPITIYCAYLKHMEEYPVGSNSFKPHSYHVTKICLFNRGFQTNYLKRIMVYCDEDITDNTMKTLREIGFESKNILKKNDSDSERAVSGSSMPHKQEAKTNFILKHKDNKLGEKIVCVSCNGDIRPDSYLIRESGDPVHIEKQCVQKGTTDLSDVKCYVYNLLRNYNELNKLLACGFLEHRIFGDRPLNPAIKGKDSEYNSGPQSLPPPQPPPTSLSARSSYFIYRRNDASLNNRWMCIGCKTIITQTSFLTFGDSFGRPVHIRKKCIQSNDLKPVIFSQVKCKVFSLLKSFEELQDLLACGFYYNNIIGVRPQNPNHNRADPGKSIANDSNSTTVAAKDVGFIFNQEAFNCERLIRSERCEGCTKFVNKRELSLRHKERIPREKLAESPLISQFYHAAKNCLMKRGFTEMYLDFSVCYVVLTEQDDPQSVKDILVRCGFVSNNIKYTTNHEIKPNVSFSEPVPVVEESPMKYLYIVNCMKLASACGGCGFNIGLNEACFKYGPSATQDNIGKLFHIQRSCLEIHFTRTEMLSLICINNNSIADVDAAVIVRCGIENIRTMHPPQPKKHTNKATHPLRHDGHKRDPLRASRHNFIVNTLIDNRTVCSGCNMKLQYDRCVLQAISSDDSPNIYMHISAQCVKNCDFFPQQLANCDVVLSMDPDSKSLQILRECGFINFI